LRRNGPDDTSIAVVLEKILDFDHWFAGPPMLEWGPARYHKSSRN
jgi:hypothetical protein